MLDRSLALGLRLKTVGCLGVRTAHWFFCLFFITRGAGGRTTMTLLRERERSDDNDARAFLLSNTAEERAFLIAG